MKAAVVEVFKEPLKIWNDRPDPEVGPDDVLVKVRANGICRSDWHLWQGHWDWMGFSPPLPAVLGHESAGVVEEAGSNVKRFKKGDRVGSNGMQARCYPEILRMVESGKLTPSALVTQEVSLEQAGGVLEEMSGFNTLGYVVIKMD